MRKQCPEGLDFWRQRHDQWRRIDAELSAKAELKGVFVMRAIWRVFLMVGFCGGVCPALAEKRVTATGCSNAASGVSIWTSVTINCPTVTLSKEALEQLKEALIRSGQVARAEQQGIAPSFIYRLAEQLRPGENFDVEQAKKEIEAAVAVAVKIKHEGKELSGDALLDEVRRRIAERTQAEDLKGATRAAEEGFAEWEKKEAERRAKEKKTGVALLEAALDTDLLRFDAEAAAGRVEKIVALEHEGDRKAQFEALRARQERFYVEGRDKGINFQLETAIAIARRRVALAQGPDEHGGALNDLGVTLWSLGRRESGTGTLTEAVAALREALKEQTRERVPLYWAQTQNNLGNALTNLGDRESGTGTLTEAAAAYREALKEQTRERVPLEWAQTQMNLGVTLWRLGERESGTGRSRRRLRPFARR
jgi:tetratricopeptide (TPR) repeat protein